MCVVYQCQVQLNKFMFYPKCGTVKHIVTHSDFVELVIYKSVCKLQNRGLLWFFFHPQHNRQTSLENVKYIFRTISLDGP